MAETASLEVKVGTESVKKAVVDFNKLAEVAKKTEASLNRVAGTNPVSKQLKAVLDEAANSLAAFAREGGDAERQMELLQGSSKRLNDILGESKSFIQQAAEELAKEAGSLKNLGEEIENVTARSKGLKDGMSDVGQYILSFGKSMLAGFTIEKAVDGIFKFAEECQQAKKRLDELSASYNIAFGGQGGQLLDSVGEQCRQLGLNFHETAAQAREFFELGKNSSIASEMDKIFASVMTAGRALSMTDEQVKNALGGIGELAQQETIRFHDLADKLGNTLPNALDTAARAMGMTTSELAAFAGQGKLTAEDLLPKLAAALREEYSQTAEDAAGTVEGATARMQTAWEHFKANLAASGPAKFIVQFIAEGLEGINSFISANSLNKQANALLQKAGGSSYVYDSWGGGHAASEDELNIAKAAINTSNNLLPLAASYLGKEGKEATSRFSQAYAASGAGKVSQITSRRKQVATDAQKAISYAESIGSSKEAIEELKRQAKELDAWYEKLETRAQKAFTGSGKSSRSAASAAQKATIAQADYTSKIADAEAQAKKLEAQLNKNASVDQYLALEKQRIESEYAAELKKNADERVKMQGKISAAELESYKIAQDKVAELNKDLKLKDAQKQASQKISQITRSQLSFYKELGQLSGNYGQSVALQNQLLEEQARKYEQELGLSHEICEEWLSLQKLYASQDPFDGAYRGLLKFSAEYADSSREWENLTYNFGKNFMQTTRSMFDEFIDTGKTSFDSLQALFRQLLKDMAWQALAQPIMLSVVNFYHVNPVSMQILMPCTMPYWKAVLVAHDQLINAVCARGWPVETISTRAFRWHKSGKRS